MICEQMLPTFWGACGQETTKYRQADSLTAGFVPSSWSTSAPFVTSQLVCKQNFGGKTQRQNQEVPSINRARARFVSARDGLLLLWSVGRADRMS